MTHRDVFILGAGFSKAINSRMPTMKELTAAVSERIEISELSLPPPLRDSEDRGRALESNIELWMTYLSQRQPWLDESFNQYNLALATRIRRYIKEIINQSTSDSMESAPTWLGPLLEEWSARQVSVITLNYDTLVERAAEALSKPEVNGGHGVSTSQVYPPYFSSIRSRTATLVSASPLDTFTYLKLHGSVNWHYSGREDFYGETIFYSDVSPWGPKQNDHEKKSRLTAGDKETLIILPVSEKTTFFNNETVRRLWQEASDHLEGATRVFVIGYSLPISDLGMQFFLKRSLPIQGTPWYIVDTDKKVIGRYRDLLAPQQTIHDDFVGEDAVSRFANAYPNIQ